MGEKAEYSVIVKTGDRWSAGTDANVRMIFRYVSGDHTRELKLDNFFRDDFERGRTDKFKIKNVQDGPLIEIELWRDNSGIGSSWFVDTIEVVNTRTRESYVFPLFRWVKANYHYVIRHLDTSLPQLDPNLDQRTMELADKTKVYVFAQKVPQGPAQIKAMPEDEHFSFDYKWNIIKKKAQMIAASKIVMLTSGNWESLGHLKNVYTKEVFVEPLGARRWSNDMFFGNQRIASLNHSVIELVTEIPDKLGVTDEILRPFLEGWSLQQVIEAKRLFMCDLQILQDLPCKSDEFVICAPIALFFVNGKQHLVPIAIQLKQQKAPDNPVFTPTDPPYTWMMAKMWYNNADCTHHQALTHLAFTHLLMEGVTVAFHRNISPSHPIFKLLAPHFLYLIAINSRGLEVLVAADGWVDKTMNCGIKGMFELIRRGLDNWRMDVDGTLPEDLKKRGVSSNKVLPGYHFRDDAILLYNAIHNYVTKYVKLYYDTPEKISEDWEIQNWRKELIKDRGDGGVGLKGVPGDGKFETQDHLILTLTSIIYCCSVGHASTNFPQYDEYAFPPNYPGMMRGRPPTDKNQPTTEQDVLKALPDKPTTLDIMIVTKILSDKGTRSLGDFEVQYIFDPEAKKIVEEFQEEVREAGKVIKQRNRHRNIPYQYLDPDIVPNSISI